MNLHSKQIGGFSTSAGASVLMADRYKIYEQLGAGGVGTVYRAYDTQLKRWVAIKRLMTKKEATAEDDSLGDELRAEADSLASLRHPNIVTIFDVASDDEGLFIVMELLEGDDLADVINKGPLHYDDFKELAYQTLEGLLAAHQHHILHRDIKPENIKVERMPGGRMQAKIIDFGLARVGLKARKQTEDVSGTVMGSVHYMAPEQLTREPVDERTDLYSLGCVFYQALSGRKAFDGATMQEIIDRHLKHQLVPLSVAAPHVPPWLAAWVESIIAPNLDDRPASAQVAMETFRAWERAPASAPAPASGPPVDDEPVITVAIVEEDPEPMPVIRALTPPGSAASAAVPAQPPQQPAAPVSNPASSVKAQAEMTPARVATGASNRPLPKPATKRSTPTDSPSGLVPKVVIGAGTALVLMIGGCYFLGGGEEPQEEEVLLPSKYSGPSQRAVTVNYPGSRPQPPAAADRLLHVIADVGTFRSETSSDGKPFPAYAEDRVAEWRDLAPRGRDNALQRWHDDTASAPKRTTWPAGGVKPNLAVIDFATTGPPPLAMEIPPPWRMANASPFGDDTTTGPKGASVAVVFQSATQSTQARVISLTGRPSDQFSLRVAANKSLIFEVSNTGKTLRLDAPQINATRPTIAVATWDAASGKLHLLAINPALKPGDPLIQFEGTSPTSLPALPTPLGGVQIGRGMTATGAPPSNQQFSGVLAELIVYSSALPPAAAKTLAAEQWVKNYFR